ncbi:hypothetical protein EJ07DRAFT_57319, partial [Lizonia empirigonia]
CIPDSVVHDILVRYQGMRVLEDTWLSRRLEEADLLAADATRDGKEFVRRYLCLLGRSQDSEQGDLEARSLKSPETQEFLSLNQDQRGRFYSAVTFVWVLNELRWVLTNFAHSTRSSRHLELLDRCRRDLTGLEYNALLDQLDQHSVFTFMYHHLLSLHSPVLQDQASSKLPFTFTTQWQKDDVQPSRFLQLFLTAGQTYFQPPDLIDLAIRHKVARSAPYPRIALPETTEVWIHPSNTDAFPTNIALDDVRFKDRLNRLMGAHIALINRSSYGPSPRNSATGLFRRPLSLARVATDYSRRYFVDSATAAIENGESYDETRRPVQVVFAGRWRCSGFWSVWWWANSEDKARAVIARWRE